MSANDLLAAVFMFSFRINCTGTSKTVMSMNDRKGTVVTRGWLSSRQLPSCHLCSFTRASLKTSPLFLYEGVCPSNPRVTTVSLRRCLPRVAGQQPSHHYCITTAATLASPVFRYEDVCLATLVSPLFLYDYFGDGYCNESVESKLSKNKCESAA